MNITEDHTEDRTEDHTEEVLEVVRIGEALVDHHGDLLEADFSADRQDRRLADRQGTTTAEAVWVVAQPLSVQ